jgi:transposase
VQEIHGFKPIFKESSVVNAILYDKLNLVLQIIKKIIRKRLQGMSLNYHQKNIKFGKLKRIGIDEISIAKGHKYMTIVMDLDSGRIVYANKGKGSDSLTEFFKKLKASKAKIKAVSKVAFIKKAGKY